LGIDPSEQRRNHRGWNKIDRSTPDARIAVGVISAARQPVTDRQSWCRRLAAGLDELGRAIELRLGESRVTVDFCRSGDGAASAGCIATPKS